MTALTVGRPFKTIFACMLVALLAGTPGLFAQAPAPAQNARSVVWMAHPTGQRETSALLIEKFLPGDVAVGETFAYSFRLTNLTRNLSLTDLVISESLAEGLNIASTKPEPAEKTDAKIAWNLGDLAPGASVYIEVQGSLSSEGSIDQCARVNYVPQLCSSIRALQPSLILKKWVKLPSENAPLVESLELLKCDSFWYQVMVQNNGTGAAKGVVISDTLPEGIVGTNGQREFSINVGTLAAGESKAYVIKAQPEKTGTFTATANAKSSSGLTAQSGEVTVKITEPKLAIDLKAPQLRFLGRAIQYEIDVKNEGDGVAQNAIATMSLPAGTSLMKSTEGATVNQSTGVMSWPLGALAPDASRKLEVILRADQATEANVTATIQAACADPAKATGKTKLSGIAAILLEVIDVEDPIVVGTPETYVIKVTNQGSATDTNIQIVCELEEDLEFVDAGGPTGAKAVDRVITFEPLASLAPKAVVTWQVRAKALKSGDTRFKVTMKSDQIQRPVLETESTHLYE